MGGVDCQAAGSLDWAYFQFHTYGFAANASRRKPVLIRNFALPALVVTGFFATISSLDAQITGFGGTAETGWTPNNAGGPVVSVSGTGTAADVLNITAAQN